MEDVLPPTAIAELIKYFVILMPSAVGIIYCNNLVHHFFFQGRFAEFLFLQNFVRAVACSHNNGGLGVEDL